MPASLDCSAGTDYFWFVDDSIVGLKYYNKQLIIDDLYDYTKTIKSKHP